MKQTFIGAIVLVLFASSAAAQPRPIKPAAPGQPAPTPTSQPPTSQPPPTQPPPTQPPPTKPAPKPAEPASKPAEPPGGDDDAGDDVDSLRQEYLKLRDELYQSRARAAAVASALYSTKITVRLAYGSARFYTVDRATIRLDGASVYDDDEGAISSDDAVRFEGWIAPGRHVIAIRVEATGKDDERFASATEVSFVVQAVGGKDLLIVARAKDGGDIPYEWKRGEKGTYRLSIDADVRTTARPAPAKTAGDAKPAPAKAARPRTQSKKQVSRASR